MHVVVLICGVGHPILQITDDPAKCLKINGVNTK